MARPTSVDYIMYSMYWSWHTTCWVYRKQNRELNSIPMTVKFWIGMTKLLLLVSGEEICQQVKDEQVHVSDARLNAESKEFIWHQKFCHLNERSLHTLASQRLVYDFDYNTSKQMPFCKCCRRVNYTKFLFQVEVENRLKCLLVWFILTCVDHWVLNRWVKQDTSSQFVDDKTHYTWVYFLKCKSEVLSKYLEWKSLVEQMSD